MNDTHSSENNPAGERPEEVQSTLFAHLVMQQHNMAMMLMGKVAHPESGQTIKDLEAAKLFIDTLEMLETKTKGNLTREEAGLLKQSLMGLHLTFVEAVEGGPAPEGAAQPAATAPAPEANRPSAEPGPAAPAGAAAAEEHRPKFSKKY